MNPNRDIQFTGIVVTYNEERHLRECLKSLEFCEQLLVIDLGSTDSSIEIAEKCGAEIIHHTRVPIVEHIRKDAAEYSKYDWIIFLDPDEIFPVDIASKLSSIINKNPKLGLINMPWQFFFKGQPLYFSIWGRELDKKAIFHKQRIKLARNIHDGIMPIKPYESINIPRIPNYFIKHYWIDSYSQLFEKHWRYIKKEGESRYNRGESFSWYRCARETLSALKYNLFQYNGLRAGMLGIFLSMFYAWYICMSLLSLRRYQKALNLN